MGKYIGLGLGLIMLLFGVCAEAQIKPKMAQFEVLMKQLSPYLLDESKYNDPENKKNISEILKNINLNLDLIQHDPSVMNTNLKFRFKALAEGFKDVEQTFENRFLDYSYWNLKSQLHQCSACHTEKQLVDRWYSGDDLGKSDLFSQADFQFMLRGYEAAVKKYETLITGYPDNKLSDKNLGHAVKKTGYYYIRILQSDEKTTEAFTKISKNKKLPKYLSNHIEQWLNYLNVKKYRIFPEKSENHTYTQLNQFVKEREKIAAHFGVGDDRFPIDQETLMYLHRILDGNVKKELTPWLYLWIGRLQNNYKESLFDNSGELFIKECFNAFPKSKAAKICKDEYKKIKSENLK